MRHGEWSELGCAVGKSDIIEYLGYAYTVTLVWGAGLWEGPGGQSGEMMIQMQMMTETGDIASSVLDMGGLFRR
jgi:hypothetical protein